MRPDGGPPSSRPGRILIVDDHALMRHGLRELFQHYDDLEVCGESDSIEEAVRAIDAAEPDLVIVDLTLRDGSGLALVERIHHDAPWVSTLVWSMHDAKLFAGRAQRAGAAAYVSKAAPTDELIRTVRDVLSDRPPVDPDG